MSIPAVTRLDPYFVGEDPEDLQISVVDYLGVPVDVSGAVVTGAYQINYGTPVVLTGSVLDGPGGVLAVPWPSAFASAGRLTGQIVYTRGGEKRIADNFVGRVYPTVGTI